MVVVRLQEAPGAVVAPVSRERLDRHARSGVRRVDEPAVADVQTDVPETAEEDEVAGL
jgi:hypothetical protein